MSFLDKFFDGMDSAVGVIEKSKELSEDESVDSRFHDVKDVEDLNKKEFIDASSSEHRPDTFKGPFVSSRAKMLFVTTTETHILEGMNKSFLCGSFAEPIEVVARKTELNDGSIVCCGTCFRILYSRYMNG